MTDIKQYIRPSMLKLQAYSSARNEFQAENGVFLDANENPFGTLNRYPDPLQNKLKKRLSQLKNVNPSQLFIGNGSDELIDLLIRISCEPNQDKIGILSPTYGMYKVLADLNSIELVDYKLNAEFQLTQELVDSICSNQSLKLMMICSPNNPTGNCLDTKLLEQLFQRFNGIILIDEAYIDFSEQKSWIERMEEFQNCIISQTFSKAYGLANARVGIAYGSEELIGLLTKIKAPYNVSGLNQTAALNALDRIEEIHSEIAMIKQEREKLKKELNKLSVIKKIYPSEANFILVEVENSEIVYVALLAQGIVVRNRSKDVKNTIRISIGTPGENIQVIKAIKNIR